MRLPLYAMGLAAQRRRGGTATQEKLGAKVRLNLYNSNPYKQNACYLDDIKFQSEGERLTALILLEYGILPRIIPEVTRHLKRPNTKTNWSHSISIFTNNPALLTRIRIVFAFKQGILRFFVNIL